MKEKIVIWGVGGLTKTFEKYIDPAKVRAFTDSDSQKQGTFFLGRPVVAPDEIKRLSFEHLVIFASKNYDEIYNSSVRLLGDNADKILYWSHYFSYYHMGQTFEIMCADCLAKGYDRLLDAGFHLCGNNVYVCGPLKLSGCGNKPESFYPLYQRLYQQTYPGLREAVRQLEGQGPVPVFAGRVHSEEDAILLEQKMPCLSECFQDIYFTIPYGDTLCNRNLQRLRRFPRTNVTIWNLFYERLVCMRPECARPVFSSVNSGNSTTEISAKTTGQKENEACIRIYIACHKTFQPPVQRIYEPLWLGPAEKNVSGYQDDDEKPSISHLNPLLNECTGMYWIWKHARCDVTGLVHYRRYFVNGHGTGYDNLPGAEQIKEILRNYDVITAPLAFFPVTVYNQLKMTVAPQAFEAGYSSVRQTIAKNQPACIENFDYVMNGHGMFPCNMFVMKKEMYDHYCQWLFSILIEAAQRLDVTSYPAYSKRIMGFFAERLFTVWLTGQPLRVKELPVWVTETIEDPNTDITRLR